MNEDSDNQGLDNWGCTVALIIFYMQGWVCSLSFILSFPGYLSCSTLLSVFCAQCHHYHCHSGEMRERRSLLMCSPAVLVRRATPWRWPQWRILWWSGSLVSHVCTAHIQNHAVLFVNGMSWCRLDTEVGVNVSANSPEVLLQNDVLFFSYPLAFV